MGFVEGSLSKLCPFLGVAAFVGFLAPGVASPQTSVGQILPPGEAKAWVVQKCTQCHDLSPITASGHSPAVWKQIVERMLSGDVKANELERAAAYLAAAYPTGRRTRHVPAEAENREVEGFEPVLMSELANPKPADWLMFSRTYDAQRFSPLAKIDTDNVAKLGLAWSRGLGSGILETIPIVRNGIIYTVLPSAGVAAIDGTNGDLIWEYWRPAGVLAESARTKSLGIYKNLIFYAAPDGYLVALDARSGKVRWQTFAGRGNQTSSAFVAGDKVITGRSCQAAEDCFIAAHDALTGRELWHFRLVPAATDPVAATWGGADVGKMTTSSWGLPGSYDPARGLLYWGVANPGPYMRIDRHAGNPAAESQVAPAALYSNSTIALDLATGKLRWYYQHLPGDDWDTDYAHERTLITTKVNPDMSAVKWIARDVPRGKQRDVVAMAGEGGVLFVLDRANGKFLWALPLPYDVENSVISDIDRVTGRTRINYNLVHKRPGDRSLTCFFNTRSYWPTAYSPLTNAIYVPYVDNCLDMTAGGKRFGVRRPGSDPKRFAGIAKVNMTSGRMTQFAEGKAPTNGAVLVTGGNLVFQGDLDRRFSAYDARTGERLWQTILPGPISVSTISYEAKGRQYVLVMSGSGVLAPQLAAEAGISLVTGHNGIFAFALQ